MHIIDSYCIATEVHNELTIFQYTHYIAYLSCHNSCQYAKLYMVFGKLHKRITQESNTFRFRLQHFHKGAHYTVFYGSGGSIHTIIDKMVSWEIILEKGFKFFSLSL